MTRLRLANRQSYRIILSLARHLPAGVIRIADLVLVKKDQDGEVTVLELKDLGKEAVAWEPVMNNLTTLFAGVLTEAEFQAQKQRILSGG